jgi:uncharacterized protein YhdP
MTLNCAGNDSDAWRSTPSIVYCQAQQTPEWRLNKLKLTVPEASLLASGNWVRLNASEFGQRKYDVAPAPAPHGPSFQARRIADGGGLLARFGMKDVVRQASGVMEGHIAWLGSPLKIDYPTLQAWFCGECTGRTVFAG